MPTEDLRPPHAGLRVLEFARILAGPWAGQILADLGAEVIKVESPDGDDTRRWGPPFIANSDGTQDAAYFYTANRGKRSVVLDFRTEEGRATACELARGADVVIENFKAGGLARFGLDYPSLARINPRLVYCSITGFGQDGPYAARPGYDFVIQGMCGIMDLTGEPDGAPQKIGVAYADLMTGLYATIAIQAALAERERSGQTSFSFGPQVGFVPAKDIVLTIGYNLSGFKDRDFSASRQTDKGVFAAIRLKLDHNTFGFLGLGRTQ